ncbi:hypothetical protein [Pseudonocardia sp. GCM10023141]|uniref:hypothetical protein n=1 Tax=Pseudonocardia sp. GCM10023141 TaxID=3252653 RepID=UPI003620A7C2
MTSPAPTLLADLDRLAHRPRQELLAHTARAGAGTPELDALLAAFDRQGTFAQVMALQMARIAGHDAYVRHLLGAPQQSLRARALHAAVRRGFPATDFAVLLPDLPATLRRVLYRAIRRRGSAVLADALLDPVRSRFGDHEAAALLPACSGPVVRAGLPELEHAVDKWAAVGRRHPAVLLGHVDERLATAPPAERRHLATLTRHGLAAAAGSDPDGVLRLMERNRSLVPPLAGVLPVLARHDAARVVAVLLDQQRDGCSPVSRSLWRAMAGAPDPDLIALARNVDGWMLDDALRALAPARRPAVYAAVVGDRSTDESGATMAALGLLPAPARHVEARRLAALRAVDDEPARRLAVTAQLPWADAEPVLTAATRRPTAAERIEAYPLLVAAAAGARSAAALSRLLALLTRIANEQDPVRSATIGALARIPPRRFDDAAVPALRSVLVDAGQARDVSWSTRAGVRTIVVAMIRDGARTRRPVLLDAGLAVLETMGVQLARHDLAGLAEQLPRGTEHRVLDALLPRITADAAVGRFTVAIALAAGLGRRARMLPALQDVLDRARSAASDDTVRAAVELWLDAPATRGDRVERVLSDDPSTIALPSVQNAVALRRTDLLDGVFAGPSHGRFQTSGVRLVPTFRTGLSRWLPRQVAAYTALLAGIATAPGRPAHERVTAVRALGWVPAAGPALRPLVTDADVTVAEAALAALARSDEPAAELPLLLSFADGDRARVAVYAATRAARSVAPGALLTALQPLLSSTRVTSRKEGARLVAELHAPDAAAALTALWQAPQQHRDVQRAVVSAVRWLLDDPRAWTLLEDAIARGGAVAGAVLDLAPEATAPRHRARYARLVHAVAATADADGVRRALPVLGRWVRWDPTAVGLLTGRAADLTATATWFVATAALVEAGRRAEDPQPVVDLATALLGSTDPGPAPDRDLPARQRLRALTTQVLSHATTGAAPRRTARALAAVLVAAGTPEHRPLAVRLTAAAVDWDGEEALPQLQHLARLADRPVLAALAAEHLHGGLAATVRRLPAEMLLGAGRELVTGDATAARLAVAIAGVAGPATGWPAPWRELLHGLRDHADPDVRLAALDTFTAPE